MFLYVRIVDASIFKIKLQRNLFQNLHIMYHIIDTVSMIIFNIYESELPALRAYSSVTCPKNGAFQVRVVRFRSNSRRKT